MNVKIPISIGELLDKISILEIKCIKILDENKLVNIKKELSELKQEYEKIKINDSEINSLYKELYGINLMLWEVEDSIRVLEKNQKFENTFIELARTVYKTNDRRFEVKNKINSILNSEFKEEKSYEKY